MPVEQRLVVGAVEKDCPLAAGPQTPFGGGKEAEHEAVVPFCAPVPPVPTHDHSHGVEPKGGETVEAVPAEQRVNPEFGGVVVVATLLAVPQLPSTGAEQLAFAPLQTPVHVHAHLFVLVPPVTAEAVPTEQRLVGEVSVAIPFDDPQAAAALKPAPQPASPLPSVAEPLQVQNQEYSVTPLNVSPIF